LINSNFGFTPLREVWIGNCYPAHFYDHLPNEIADAFREITEITEHDTGRLQQFLEARGITVRRPVFGCIEDHLTDQDLLVKPPVCPRDDYLVLDKTLYSLRNNMPKNPWQEWLDYYSGQGYNVEYGTGKAIDYLSPPSLVRIGRDLYLDQTTHNATWNRICEWIVDKSQEYRVNISNTFGHSDSVFCPVAPGVIITSHWKGNYSHTFPGWEVFHVPFYQPDAGIVAGWHVNDQVSANRAFNEHILREAQSWIGDSRETVFEVNMLVIDEHNAIATKSYEPLERWLDDRGITVHHFPLRTDRFWDGGWHCFTLDIHREDSVTDLFPDRGNNGVYWRKE
jgi:hypothetical protein